MGKITVDDIDSKAYRGLELLVIVPIIGLGLIGIGMLLVSLVGTGGPALGFAAFAGIGYLLLVGMALLAHVVSPILLYLDATKIRDADIEWEPSPGLNAVGALFLSYLVVLNYLYNRHKYVVDWVDHNWWGYLVGVGAFGPLVFGVMFFTRDAPAAGVAGQYSTFGAGGASVLLPLALLIVSVAIFQVAIYRDATYARLNGDWHPNPANYLTIALLLVFLSPIVYPLTGGYYLLRRVDSVGF